MNGQLFVVRMILFLLFAPNHLGICFLGTSNIHDFVGANVLLFHVYAWNHVRYHFLP